MDKPRRLFTRFLFTIAAITLLCTAPVRNVSAELKSLSDNEMSAVYAEGFSNFTITPLGGGVTETLAEFNIQTYTYTTIESLKLGYHNQYIYKDPNPPFGWDQDWENIVIGQDYEDPATDFKAEGIYFKANFRNIDDPETRELESITFGAKSVTGDISANFLSFSGMIDDSADNTPEYNGHGLNLGEKTITATDSDFSISLSLTGFKQGYWVNLNQAIVQDRLYYPPP